MSIVKSLIVFAASTAVLVGIQISMPQYHEVKKEQIESTLKSITYTEDMEDFTDINNKLDLIPIKVVLMYKDKIITSNNDQRSQSSRVSEGEKNVSGLTKNVQVGDLIIKYKEDNDSFKYLGFILPLLAGLFSGAGVFVMGKLASNEADSISYLHGEIQRLTSQNQAYEVKEREFSKKVEKEVPANPEDAKKMLKDMLKEKEAMLNSMKKIQAESEKTTKEFDGLKKQIDELEDKNRDYRNKLSNVEKQDKTIEDLKAKAQKLSSDLKDSKLKLKEFESINVEALNGEIEKLKGKLEEKTEEVKRLSKYDGEKLTLSNKSLKERVASLEEKVIELEGKNYSITVEYEKTLKEGTTGELMKEKVEREKLKKELEENKHKLIEIAESIPDTDIGKYKKDNMELKEKNALITKEVEELKQEMAKLAKSEENKLTVLRDELRDRAKEFDVVKIDLQKALDSITFLNKDKEKLETELKQLKLKLGETSEKEAVEAEEEEKAD